MIIAFVLLTGIVSGECIRSANAFMNGIKLQKLFAEDYFSNMSRTKITYIPLLALW